MAHVRMKGATVAKRNIVSVSLAILAVSALAGCVSDAASLQIDGKEHSLSLVREQKWIWDQQLDLFVVVSRMPDCQRRHRLRSASLGENKVDVYSPDAVTFFLRQADRIYSVESQTCEGFKELAETPAAIGQLLGTFKEVKGVLAFVESSAKGE